MSSERKAKGLRPISIALNTLLITGLLLAGVIMRRMSKQISLDTEVRTLHLTTDETFFAMLYAIYLQALSKGETAIRPSRPEGMSAEREARILAVTKRLNDIGMAF